MTSQLEKRSEKMVMNARGDLPCKEDTVIEENNMKEAESKMNRAVSCGV